MGITSVKETWSGFEWEADTSRRRATRKWSVAVDDATTDPIDVQRDSRLPQPGDTFFRNGHFDPNLIAGPAQAKHRSGNPFLIDVTIRYQTKDEDPENDRSVHPLDRPADVRGGFRTGQVAVDEDVEGNPIATFNGETFDPPIQAPLADLRLTITKNEATVDFNADRQYANVVNNREIFNNPAGTVMMRPIQSKLRREQFGDETVVYWRRTYTLDIRRPTGPNEFVENAWKKRVLHRGFVVRVEGVNEDANGEAQPFDLGNPSDSILEQLQNRDQWPQGPVSQPVKLDAQGFVISPDSEEATWLAFQVFDRKSLDVWDLEAAVEGID